MSIYFKLGILIMQHIVLYFRVLVMKQIHITISVENACTNMIKWQYNVFVVNNCARGVIFRQRDYNPTFYAK